MATVPLPHQFAVGEVVTSSNINTFYSAISFLQQPPAFKLITTVNVPIGTGAFHSVSWNNAAIDTYHGWVVGTPTRYTSQCPGFYWISANVGWNTGVAAAGHTSVGILSVNGATFGETDALNNFSQDTGFTSTVGVGGSLLYLNVNDYVEYQVLQDTGASQNITQGQLVGFWVHS